MVKPGYKQTEIGVLPEAWRIVQLKDISVGKFTYGVNAAAVEYMPPLPNYIRITDISDEGHFVRENRASVICANPELFTLKENDIVFARTGASTGKTYLYRQEDGELVYAGFLIKASIDPLCADSRYIFAALHTKEYWNWVATASMRSGQPGINGNEYALYQIALPELSEQTYIADALENTDNLISSLEKQISKKKAIKQGAMQELLTGKKRLSGFSGEWKNYQLRDLGEFLKSSGISRAESNTGKIPAVRYGELYTHHQNYVIDYVSHISKDVAVKAKQVYKGDILFAASGETKEEIGKCAAIISQETVYAGGDILIFRPNVNLNPIFMGTLLNTADVCRQRAEKGQGDAVVHIHADSLASIKIRIPEISEQDAIAGILFEMDKEIKLLEQKLSKYRHVKQGMMQQLLTGKIRLV